MYEVGLAACCICGVFFEVRLAACCIMWCGIVWQCDVTKQHGLLLVVMLLAAACYAALLLLYEQPLTKVLVRMT